MGVLRGAPTNLACEGRVACLAGLVRRAYLPRFVDAALRKHDHAAAIVAGARHVPVSRTVLVESVCRQGGTHSGTVPTGRGSRDDSRESTAGIRGGHV